MERTRLSEPEWQAREAAHQARVDRLTAGHRARREAGERHPVHDFLFDYYGQSPAKLRRWHPGPGVILEGAARGERRGWTYYAPPAALGDHTPMVDTQPPACDAQPAATPALTDHTPTVDTRPPACDGAAAPGLPLTDHTPMVEKRPPGCDQPPAAGRTAAGRPADLALDVAAFLERRGRAVDFTRKLLTATLGRPMQSGCFGLHEWAMVYRQPADRRHGSWPLRLGAEGTDAVVEAHQLRCTHFDAFRFFTPEAGPRNSQPLSRDTQIDDEQPGCVHAGMDVYRWAFKLAPAVPSELVADAFELACELRELDMRASPYDLTALGYAPIAIETADGKRDYAARQRELGEQANALRRRLLSAIDTIEAFDARTRGASTAPHLSPVSG